MILQCDKYRYSAAELVRLAVFHTQTCEPSIPHIYQNDAGNIADQSLIELPKMVILRL